MGAWAHCQSLVWTGLHLGNCFNIVIVRVGRSTWLNLEILSPLLVTEIDPKTSGVPT